MILKALVLLSIAQLITAQECSSTNCVLPNCRCMGTTTPGDWAPQDTPQLVFLTFDDSITSANFGFYESILASRTNPNGCPITATFYVSHLNNDYVATHSLYWRGNEIGDKTISNTKLNSEVWTSMETSDYVDEIGGLRDILNLYANIPKSSVQGYRSPLLQANGDKTFAALEQIAMLYDASFATNSSPAVWPYTLDYGFTQDCRDPLNNCPTDKYPGFWEVPIVPLISGTSSCAFANGCPTPANASETFNFLMNNFNLRYDNNRTPLGIYLSAAWFQATPHTLTGYLNFLDEILKNPDVWIVSVKKGIEWMKNPSPLPQVINSPAFACPAVTPSACSPETCSYLDENDMELIMRSCNPCPENYPWVGNPEGTARRGQN